MGWHTFEAQGISRECIRVTKILVEHFEEEYQDLEREVQHIRGGCREGLLVTIEDSLPAIMEYFVDQQGQVSLDVKFMDMHPDHILEYTDCIMCEIY